MKKSKVLKVAVVFVALLLSLSTVLFASDIPNYSPKGSTSNATNSLQNSLNYILGAVQVIAIGVAVIMLVVLAIKYMAASPNDKAEIKKHIVVYVVGAVLLFAAAGVLGIIKEFAGTLGNKNALSQNTP